MGCLGQETMTQLQIITTSSPTVSPGHQQTQGHSEKTHIHTPDTSSHNNLLNRDKVTAPCLYNLRGNDVMSLEGLVWPGVYVYVYM